MRNKGRQRRTVMTVNGRITLRRIRWQPKTGGSLTPVDEWRNAAGDRFTRGVVELACRLNRCESGFQELSLTLKRAAGLSIGKESLRQLIKAEGQRGLEKTRRNDLGSDWHASDCQTPEGETRVYFGCDGVKVPVITDQEKKQRRDNVVEKRKQLKAKGRSLKPLECVTAGADGPYKEIRLVQFYSEDQTQRWISVSRGDHEVVGRLMRRDASRIRLDRADASIGLYDGAVWIDRQAEKQGLRLTARGLDFWHLQDYAQKKRRAHYGDDEAGKTWRKELMHTFKHEGDEPAWDQLTTQRATLESEAKKTALDNLLHYMAERRHLIHDPTFRAKGWQIGSGPTEAQCGTTTDRIKGKGRRWNPENTLALMALE
ncbi:MAG: hypothetical protein KDA84_09185, partial [Planctomycetaceae bacterium]|nr:hypothetical protein [Planctomycetaceae bacterium]